jgi:hypothetical protein
LLFDRSPSLHLSFFSYACAYLRVPRSDGIERYLSAKQNKIELEFPSQPLSYSLWKSLKQKHNLENKEEITRVVFQDGVTSEVVPQK